LDDIASPKRPLYRYRTVVNLNGGKACRFSTGVRIFHGTKKRYRFSNCKEIIGLEGFWSMTNLELLFLSVLR
jgi:hypothetical protein